MKEITTGFEEFEYKKYTGTCPFCLKEYFNAKSNKTHLETCSSRNENQKTIENWG